MTRQAMKNNARRFSKHASAYIRKDLFKIAKSMEYDLAKIVEDELRETYMTELTKSYEPRSEKSKRVLAYNKDEYNTHKKKLVYRHTHTLEKAVEIEKEYGVTAGKFGNVQVVINKNVKYDDGRAKPRTAVQVHKFLTEGTDAARTGQIYAYKIKGNKNQEDGTGGGINYPTPKHNFEEITMAHITNLMKRLGNELESGTFRENENYKKYKIKKRKRR